MTRYFFDFRENSSILRDDEGVELIDAKTAELEAVKAAAAIAEENFRKGCNSVVIDVREGERPAFKVSLRLDVEQT